MLWQPPPNVMVRNGWRPTNMCSSQNYSMVIMGLSVLSNTRAYSASWTRLSLIFLASLWIRLRPLSNSQGGCQSRQYVSHIGRSLRYPDIFPQRGSWLLVPRCLTVFLRKVLDVKPRFIPTPWRCVMPPRANRLATRLSCEIVEDPGSLDYICCTAYYILVVFENFIWSLDVK